MNDKSLVANVDDAADAIARMEGSRGAGVIFHSAVVVAMLNLLKMTQWVVNIKTVIWKLYACCNN